MQSNRVVAFGLHTTGSNDEFVNNGIVTSKYTVFSFLPKNLFEQCRRVANLYFLFQSMLMVIGWYAPHIFQSPVHPWSTLGTLVFVMSITLIKDGLEDLYRHQSDERDNNAEVSVFRGTSASTIMKKDVLVGDFVVVHKMEQIPADLVLVASSNDKGQCYVETSNIDGETNLKIRTVPRHLYNQTEGFSAEQVASAVQGIVVCDLPNVKVHSFDSRLSFKVAGDGGAQHSFSMNTVQMSNTMGGQVDGGETVPVSVDNFLARGSTLRNTEWVVGVAVYTGPDTKIMKNMRKVPFKMSTLDRTVNRTIRLVFLAHFILVLTSTILHVVMLEARRSPNGEEFSAPFHLSSDDFVLPYWLANFFTFYILYGNMVPISLYVTIEMVNVAQSYFIGRDMNMYHAAEDTRAVCRNSTLCQELGQIEYVFSDKTGTLTCNVMKFQRCSVPSLLSRRTSSSSTASSSRSSSTGKLSLVALTAESMREQMDTREPLFFLVEMFALCNNVVPEMDDETGQIVYQAESPDEGALVESAEQFGIRLVGRTYGRVTVAYDRSLRRGSSRKLLATTTEIAAEGGTVRTSVGNASNNGGSSPNRRISSGAAARVVPFDILAENAFNSTRKRMSVVVRMPDGRILVMCKGADSAMLPLCNLSERGKEECDAQLLNYASSGLRTLVFGYREVSAGEFEQWHAKFQEAQASIADRAEKLAAVADLIENDLTVAGITGVEDKLQDQVPETIEALRDAGIKLWVLTGDKVETAVNIGQSCHILDDSKTAMLTLLGEDMDHLQLQMRMIQGIQKSYRDNGDQHWSGDDADEKRSNLSFDDASATPARDIEEVPMDLDRRSVVLVVDGSALHQVMDHPELSAKLLAITSHPSCSSVIACRVTPKQKASIVSMVKRGVSPMPVTLAIGDGANDVTMIREAHVGVGISGREGRQAVNSSDFAIAQFKFLAPLLLLHGTWDYIRMTKVVLLCFYKNIALVMTVFTFNFCTLMTGTSLYDSWVYAGFNFFTGMPPVMVGMFDQKFSRDLLQRMPRLYQVGPKRGFLNSKLMCAWISRAILHGGITVLLSFSAYGLLASGDQWPFVVSGLQSYGTVVFTAITMVVMTTLGMETSTWNGLVVFFFFGSMVFYYFSVWFLSTISLYSTFRSVFDYFIVAGISWFFPVLMIGLCYLIDVATLVPLMKRFAYAVY